MIAAFRGVVQGLFQPTMEPGGTSLDPGSMSPSPGSTSVDIPSMVPCPMVMLMQIPLLLGLSHG